MEDKDLKTAGETAEETDGGSADTETAANEELDTEKVSLEKEDSKEEEKPSEDDDDDDDEEDDTAKKVSKKAFLRKLKYGSIATAITVFVLAAVVIVNILVTKASDKVNMSLDLTENKNFEISQQSIDYLATVNEHVDIVCLTDETTFKNSNYVYYKQAYEVLKKYTIYNDNVELTFVDMVKNPTYAERYKNSYKGEISAYSIVVESSKRIRVLTIQDLYNTEVNYQTFSEEIVSSKAEQELTSAIMYVTDPDPIQAVALKVPTQGYSYDNVINILTANGCDVTEIDPFSEPIPEDTDLIVVNAPLNDFDEDTIDQLYSFLDNGGALGKNMIYIADYSQKTTENIDKFLGEWGIKVGEGVVGDDDSANLVSQSYYIVRDYIKDNDYSKNVAEMTLPFVDYQSRPLELLFDHSDTRSTYALMQTADTGFVLTDDMRRAAENGEKFDIEHGVQTTMALGRKYVFDSDNNMITSNVLVVGSSETLDESLTNLTYLNNGEYFVSILNSMTGKNTGISIVAKDLSGTSFDIDQQTVTSYLTLFVVIIPASIVLIGILVFFRRRAL